MAAKGMSAKGSDELAAQLRGLYSELKRAKAHLARWNSLGKRFRGTRDEGWKRVKRQREAAEMLIRKVEG
jgi:hypothetical protein